MSTYRASLHVVLWASLAALLPIATRMSRLLEPIASPALDPGPTSASADDAAPDAGREPPPGVAEGERNAFATHQGALEAAPAQRVDVVGRVVARATDEAVPLAAIALLADRWGAGGFAAMPEPDPPGERVHGVADRTGRFRFAVAPGRYVLEARATGFAPARVRFVAPAAVEVRLAASAVVEGFVRGPEGAPAAGAEVLLAGGEELIRDIAGASGGFAVEVTPGTYSVTARSDRAAGAWPVPVAVAAGRRARGIEIRLGRPGAISGTVVARDGAPVQGASVAVTPHGAAGEVSRADTDASGRFVVEPVGAGAYDVCVTGKDRTPEVRSGIALLAGERVELAFTLERTGEVEGAVTDGAERPLAGVRVRAAPQIGAAPGLTEKETRTDAAGRFRLSGLAAGPSKVSAARDDTSSGVWSSVDVVPGSVTRLDLTLREAGRLEGMVLRSDRGRIGSAVVVVVSPGFPSPLAQAEVDEDGRYSLQLAAGDYRAFAAPQESASLVPERLAPVRIAPGGVSRLDLVLEAGGAGHVAVQVLEPGGSGSAGALVLVTTVDDLRSGGSAVSDADGVARLDVSERGSLHVRAFRGGRVGGPVPLAAPTTTVVTLRAASQLRGRVVKPEGSRVAGFSLRLSALGDDAAVASALGGAAGAASAGGVQAPRTLEFGGDRFELADVPAGPVRVSVRTGDGRSGHAEVELAPGDLRDVEVVLEPGPTIGAASSMREASPPSWPRP